MGAQAQVWGYGPFYRSLIDDLDYPADWYSNVKERDLIFAALLGYCSGTTRSREIAEELGVDIKNPGTWVIAPYSLKGNLCEGEHDDWFTPGESDRAKQLNSCIKANRLGWTLFFTPNC